MALFDPVSASFEVENSYRRYLKSTHWVNDDSLRKEFERALDGDFKLTQGPLLQAMIPYETGASLEDLVEEGVLHRRFLEIDPTKFPPGRPLYLHQEEAIRKSQSRRNLIVATGTGSGKTECFLLPVINHLLNEQSAGTLSQPGVRAMFLYPMNALANDQMKRIRDLLSAFPEITFGRFIGDTKETHSKARPLHISRTGTEPLPNELISRDEIRENPPHILLTNYAMLERLLLYPKETTLFDGPTADHWRFIALDEVHVYDGAQGAEIAMLLRRVRDRVNNSKRKQIQFIGTSATLGKGESDYPNLADFAEKLFDEEVEYSFKEREKQDVIGPTRQRLQHGSSLWELNEDQIFQLMTTVTNNATKSSIVDLLTNIGAPFDEELDDWREVLGSGLETERKILQLQESLESGSQSLKDLTHRIFPGPGPGSMEKITSLVFLGVQAISTRTNSPLIPARYHFLLRSLEGAFVCQSPSHPSGTSRLSLARHDQCPACLKENTVSKVFELGACRKCGAGYLVGRVEEENEVSYLMTASIAAPSLHYLLLTDSLPEDDTDEDESAVTKDELVAADLDNRILCSACGSLTEGLIPGCDCGAQFSRDVVVAHPKVGSTDLRKCISCSGRSTAPIIMRFQTGQDAPVAVIATALYQSLPPSSGINESSKIGEGRKLLSFADSRQDAAFFAPYLNRTYSRAVERRILWEIISRDAEEILRFEDLVPLIRKLAEDSLVLDPDSGGAANSARVRHWLMREILAVDRRQSLDGVGLAEISLALPRGVVPPPALLDLGFTEQETIDLVLVLLETLRLQAAVSLPGDVQIEDQMFSPRNVITSSRLEQSAYGILAWVPKFGSNRRLDFLSKVLKMKGIETEPRQLLSDLWTRFLTAPEMPLLKVFSKHTDRREGEVLRLDHQWITFEPSGEDHRPFTCQKCQQIWWRTVAFVCPTFKCDGVLEPLDTRYRSGAGHYRHLYEKLAPIGLNVKEHTGQLESGYAAELQQKFIDGDINALSCSTTFELGVDVGEVQAVLMKNVPPTPANYVQRAGRAGRRAGSTALVVTFAQRRNHDLHYFKYPSAMVDGSVATPIISLDNPQIVRRHLHAIAFAEFEKRHVKSGGDWHESVGEFFVSTDDSVNAPVDSFIAWLLTHPPDLGEAVSRVTPTSENDQLSRTLGIDDWGWVDALIAPGDHVESHGWLTRAAEEARCDIEEVRAELKAANERWQELTRDNKDQKAMAQNRRMMFLQRVQTTIQSRRLIDYLAQRVVIPKYGFPVDVVTMDVTQAGDDQSSKIDLSRDLRIGISEFAPGSQIVADGAYWIPLGLRVPAAKELLQRSWVKCGDCSAFQTGRNLEEFECEVCGGSKTKGKGNFIVPEFGFIGERSKDLPGEARPVRNGMSETYFSDYATDELPDQIPMLLGERTIRYSFSRQGEITVINSGSQNRGFRVCLSCGRAEEVPRVNARRNPKGGPHERPGTNKTPCSAHFRSLSFGHQFLTDVVEIDLGIPMNRSQAMSCLWSLLAACPEIGITRDDVTGALRSQGADQSPSLILIDAVPGGAGHAMKIRERLESLVGSALQIVSGCECGIDSSCYSCLRTYTNQSYHDDLIRGDALEILKNFATN